MRVAVTGANGQLGSDVVAACTAAGHDVIALTHAEVELADAANVREVLAAAAPNVVINTAAMNHVEGCEADPAAALVVNAAGVRNIALAARDSGAKLVHLSTDYVFDGLKAAPYIEADVPRPVNAYGTSKLAGEHFVTALHPEHFVVRTSALFGVNRCRAKPHDNFVRAMLQRGRERGEVSVVNDERVSPTWTADLASQILRLSHTEHYGVYHATSQGECSWFEFARAIFEMAGVVAEVKPAGRKRDRGLKRPRYSVLDNDALRRIGLDVMPDWRTALGGYLAAIGERR